MGLTGDPRPTFAYLRVIYQSGAGLGGYGVGGYGEALLDFDDPAETVSPPLYDIVRTETISPSGRRKVLLERTEEQRQLTWQLLDANKAFELQDFFRRWGGLGKQSELFIDRFTGAFYEFEGTLEDQQGTLATLTGQGSYETATFGQGLRLGAGGFLDVPTLGTVGTMPSLLAAEGVFVLLVAPSFAGNDGISHTLLNVDPAGNGRLWLEKTTGNALVLTVEDAAAALRQVSIAVSWGANSVQKIVGKWKDAAGLELWLNGVQGPAPTGAGTGILPSLPTALRMGAVAAGSSEANGLYDRLGFLTRAFALHASIVQKLTDDFFPRWKNYYPAAEVMDVRFALARQTPARDLYRASLTFRAGIT